MDNADNEEKFDECLASIRERLDAIPLPVQFPIGVGKDLKGVVDVVEQKAYYFQTGDRDENYQIKEIPSNLLEKTKQYRQKLLEGLEKITEQDEELAMKYLEGQDLQTKEIKKLLRQATLTGNFFPLFCGSAYRNVGVKMVLDGIVDYLPSPLEVGEIPVFSPSKNKSGKDQENVTAIREEITELEKSLNNLELALSNQTAKDRTDQALQVVKFEMEERLIELRKQLEKTEKNKITCDSPISCLALVFKVVIDEYNNR